MADQSQESTGEHFSLRLKAFYAGLFLTLGVQLPFLPVWLSAISRPALSLPILPGLILLKFLRSPRRRVPSIPTPSWLVRWQFGWQTHGEKPLSAASMAAAARSSRLVNAWA